MEDNKEVSKKKTTIKKKSTNRININKVKKEQNEKKLEEKVIDNIDIDSSPKNTKKGKSSSSFNLIEVIIIMIITAIFGIMVGSFVTYFKNNVIDDNTPEIFDEFLEVYYEIVDGYYEDIDSDMLIEAGIRGMAEYLGDPFSSYLDYDATYSLNEELEGEFVGMGATVSTNENGDKYIVEILDNSPALKSGFEVGDIIKKVDNKSVEDFDVVDVAYLIKGEENTKVDIVVDRNGEEKLITLTRGKVELTSVTYEILQDSNIGYIYLSVFAKNTPEQFKKAMDDLKDKGVQSVIVDVRGNSGGYLTTAEDIIGLFLDKGSVMYQLNTKGKIEKIKTNNNKRYDMEIAVLIDGGSASASEVLASALKENLGVSLIGTKSYGKGTVQKTKELSSGSMIKYTVQEWYTPNGNKVDGVGIVPDYEVYLGESYFLNPIQSNDAQLQKAIEILKK